MSITDVQYFKSANMDTGHDGAVTKITETISENGQLLGLSLCVQQV